MSRLDRRRFLDQARLAAAAAAGGPVRRGLAGQQQSAAANEKLSVAVIGVGWRGPTHANQFAARRDCEVTYICDADRQVGIKVTDQIAALQGRRPNFVQDMRRIFDDASVDAVSTASPNHWHALCAIWAMQSGKDVYVEKPVSHAVSEGRRIVQAARKYDKICQTGTQRRSEGPMAAAARYMHEGKLGDLKLARCLCFKRRQPIGPPGTYEPPPSVDYNLWAGPAPAGPITRPKFHYDWHWFWDFGNGELGNSSVHRADVARWGLGLTGLGRGVISYGGRVGYQPGADGGQTPNTQVSIHDFGDKTVVQEIRGLETGPYRDCANGVIFYGSEGIIATTNKGTSLFDPDGKLVRPFEAPDENHFGNFIEAVRSRNPEDLNAEILEGHQSSALCHLGNISHRLGREASPGEILARLESVQLEDDAAETFERVRRHLADNDVDIEKTRLVLGPWLAIDSDRECFVANPAADALLECPYREPFVVPKANEL